MPRPAPQHVRPFANRIAGLIGVAALAGVWGVSTAEAAAEAPSRRAKPPTFSQADRAAFFEDAFSVLEGARPDFAASSRPVVAASAASNDTGRSEWSRWISTDTLETEIKRLTREIATLTQSASKFKGGGYQQARDAFSTMALMFAVSAVHDDDARWSDRANGLAALLGRAGTNCKVGTDNSHREASARSDDLAELVRGGRPNTPRASKPSSWGELADRGPIMRRMELAWQDRLGPATGSERSFRRGAEDVLHEAQVLAALSEAITLEGFEDADDEDYARLARVLRDASAEIAEAAEQENYTTMREAYSRAGKSCAECHELYRG